jgi:hypothetical protein
MERGNLMGAEMALREMGAVDLLEALDYLAVLADVRPGLQRSLRRVRPKLSHRMP